MKTPKKRLTFKTPKRNTKTTFKSKQLKSKDVLSEDTGVVSGDKSSVVNGSTRDKSSTRSKDSTLSKDSTRKKDSTLSGSTRDKSSVISTKSSNTLSGNTRSKSNTMRGNTLSNRTLNKDSTHSGSPDTSLDISQVNTHLCTDNLIKEIDNEISTVEHELIHSLTVENDILRNMNVYTTLLGLDISQDGGKYIIKYTVSKNDRFIHFELVPEYDMFIYQLIKSSNIEDLGIFGDEISFEKEQISKFFYKVMEVMISD